MVLKAATDTNLQDDGWKWEKNGEKIIYLAPIMQG